MHLASEPIVDTSWAEFSFHEQQSVLNTESEWDRGKRVALQERVMMCPWVSFGKMLPQPPPPSISSQGDLQEIILPPLFRAPLHRAAERLLAV